MHLQCVERDGSVFCSRTELRFPLLAALEPDVRMSGADILYKIEPRTDELEQQ